MAASEICVPFYVSLIRLTSGTKGATIYLLVGVQHDSMSDIWVILNKLCTQDYVCSELLLSLMLLFVAP